MSDLLDLEQAVDDASRAYARASEALEAALAGRDDEARFVAEGAMRDAADALARAQSALVIATRGPSFEDLLASPTEQFDLRGELLASILRYQQAASATAASSQRWVPSHASAVFGSPASILPPAAEWVPAERPGRRRRAS